MGGGWGSCAASSRDRRFRLIVSSRSCAKGKCARVAVRHPRSWKSDVSLRQNRMPPFSMMLQRRRRTRTHARTHTHTFSASSRRKRASCESSVSPSASICSFHAPTCHSMCGCACLRMLCVCAQFACLRVRDWAGGQVWREQACACVRAWVAGGGGVGCVCVCVAWGEGGSLSPSARELRGEVWLARLRPRQPAHTLTVTPPYRRPRTSAHADGVPGVLPRRRGASGAPVGPVAFAVGAQRRRARLHSATRAACGERAPCKRKTTAATAQRAVQSSITAPVRGAACSGCQAYVVWHARSQLVRFDSVHRSACRHRHRKPGAQHSTAARRRSPAVARSTLTVAAARATEICIEEPVGFGISRPTD